METCKLCGNPHKEEKISCTFCTGDQRQVLGVPIGAMYQREFEPFRDKSYTFSPVAAPLLRVIMKMTGKENRTQGMRPFKVGVWGGSSSGKTWLMYAFLQEVLLSVSKYGKLLFTVIEETNDKKLSTDDVRAEIFIDSRVTFPFPIEPTPDVTQKVFYFLRKKYYVPDGKETMIPEPGVNSHINEINTFDDKGGRFVDPINGATINHLPPEEQDAANLARQRIAESNYIVLLVGGTDNADTLISGLSEQANMIRQQIKLNQSKKIAVCLNKVERKPGFKAHWKEPKKLQGKDIFKSLLTAVFGDRKSTLLMNIFIQLENLPLTEVNYFVISSCGYCKNEKTPNLDSAKSNQAPLQMEKWEPINVLPVFEWFFSHIEHARIDCRDEVFLKFYRLPDWLTKYIPKPENPYNLRLREYVRYTNKYPTQE